MGRALLAAVGARGPKPATPSIATAAITTGGTISITPGGGGAAPVRFDEYLDGLPSGRSVAASGGVVNYTQVAADIRYTIDFRAVGRDGQVSGPSNTLVYAGLAASLTAGNILRDTNQQTVSGSQVSNWADDGAFAFPTLDGAVNSPDLVYYLGQRGLKFTATSTQQMVPHSGGTLVALTGTGSYDRWQVASPGTVIDRSSTDLRDCDPIFNDPSVTDYASGFINVGGTIYYCAGIVGVAVGYKQTPRTANTAVVPGQIYLIRETFDRSVAGGTLSIQVTPIGGVARPAESVVVGAAINNTTGTVKVGINYLNRYGNFTLYAVAGGLAVQNAGAAADITAYLTNTYLMRQDYTPTRAEVWGDGESTSRFGLPIYSSLAMLVADTTSRKLYCNVSIYGVGVDATNDVEFKIALATGAGPVQYTSVVGTIPAQHTDGSGYMVVTLPPIAIPGSGSVRVWLEPPAHASSITYTLQSVQYDYGSTWTPVAEPTSGQIFVSEATGGVSLGNSNVFGWYYIAGVEQGGGYATSRTACLARIVAETTGWTSGSVFAISPQTNDERAGTTASDGALQAVAFITDLRAVIPAGVKIIYCTLGNLGSPWDVGQVAWRAAEAAAITSLADGVIDGSQFQYSDDHVHWLRDPSILALRTQYAALRSALGLSGTPTLAIGPSIAVTSGKHSANDQTYINPPSEGISNMIRQAGTVT